MPRRVLIKTEEGAESFGPRLRRLRKEAGYSLADLAEKVGISNRMLHHYEAKEGNPPVNLLPILAKVLGISAEKLLGLDKKHTSKKVKA
jgi:transcriptional regulator with XRE-family HTH domain